MRTVLTVMSETSTIFAKKINKYPKKYPVNIIVPPVYCNIQMISHFHFNENSISDSEIQMMQSFISASSV